MLLLAGPTPVITEIYAQESGLQNTFCWKREENAWRFTVALKERPGLRGDGVWKRGRLDSRKMAWAARRERPRSCASLTSRWAMRAAMICKATALRLAPRKWCSLRFCLTHLKNNSICQTGMSLDDERKALGITEEEVLATRSQIERETNSRRAG